MPSTVRSSCDPEMVTDGADPVTAFQVQNPALYEAATENLDLDQQTLLMDVLRVAEAQANEAAAAAPQA